MLEVHRIYLVYIASRSPPYVHHVHFTHRTGIQPTSTTQLYQLAMLEMWTKVWQLAREPPESLLFFSFWDHYIHLHYLPHIYIYTDISLTFPLRRYTVYVTNGSLQTFKGWWTIQFIQMPCDHWGLLGFPGWDGIIGHLPRTPRIRPYESPDFLLWNLHL